MYQTFYESGYVCLEGSNKLEHVKQIVETTLLLTAFTGTAAFNIYIYRWLQNPPCVIFEQVHANSI